MALRMVDCILPRGQEDACAESLDGLNVQEQSWWAVSEDRFNLRVLVESDYAESVITTLDKAFGQHTEFRLTLQGVEATLPVPEKRESVVDEQVDTEPPERVACLELVTAMTEGTELNRTFFLTVFLSTVVAAVGLIRNNVAVVIGAMVIAPLLMPNMALALGTTLGDRKLSGHAIRTNLIGLFFACMLAVLMGFWVPFDPATPEIVSRTVVALGDVALALAAGAAGALAFTSGVSAALVGVMVAVALLPPLVTGGLLIGAGQWIAGGQALLLLLTNIICVNLAGVGTFLLQGIRPTHYWQEKRAARMVRVALILWISLLLILVVSIMVLETAL